MGDEPDDAGRKMSKLPFVWELKYKGIISHGAGIIHTEQNIYENNIKKLFKDKECLLVEQEMRGKYFLVPYTLEPAIHDFAYVQAKLPVISLETTKEHRAAGKVYENKHVEKSKLLRMKKAYKEGDEKTIKRLVQKDLKDNYTRSEVNEINKRNEKIASRSLEHILKKPSLLVCGIFHFVAYEPTLIDFYKEKGIEVKRVQ